MAESTRASKKAKQEAPKSGFGPGDFVTNPLKPDWGPGRVVDLKRDVVYVYFRDRPGKEVIRMKQSGLKPGESDPELQALPAFIEKNGGFALEKAKRGAKAKKPPVIVFDEPDEPEIEEIELDASEMEMEEEE